MLEKIPQELKNNGLWCAWKRNPIINGKVKDGKIPYNVKTGFLAKSNDKNTFYPYATVLNYIQNYLSVDENGIFNGGFGIGVFNGYSAIDIDHCVDDNGNFTDMASDIIEHCKSYMEKSPSGKGIRIIFKCDYKLDNNKYYINNKKIGLEVYLYGSTNKFLTITGNSLNKYDKINTVDNDTMEYILDKYMLKKLPQILGGHSSASKEPLINKLLESDLAFKSYWEVNDSINESEHDMKLLCKLAFYFQKNPTKMREVFETSPHYLNKDASHLKKWERDDYRNNTIQKAIDCTTNVYNPTFYLDKELEYTDSGNASRFIEKFGDKLLYNFDDKKWMIWNGMYWMHDSNDAIKTYAECLIESIKMESLGDKEAQKNIKKLSNKSGKEAMLIEAQHHLPCTNSDFDNDPFLLNCKSGVIDLKTKQIFSHDKKYMMSKLCPYEIDTKNKPKLFLKFLDSVFEGDVELISFVKRIFGYALTGSMREQKMFMFIGDGSNGKSVLMQVVTEIMGDYATTSDTSLLIDRGVNENTKTTKARLKGIRLVNTSEIKENEKLNEPEVKKLTAGNDEIVARYLYGNEFMYYPIYKIFMLANYEPIIRGSDNGIWRRIIKIDFKHIYTESEQDKDLIYKLRKEYPQILYWLVEGAYEYFTDGLKVPKSIELSKSKYRKDMDIIEMWIDECCIINPNVSSKAADLFSNFNNWCKTNKLYELNNTIFGRNLTKKGYAKERKNNGYYYTGLCMRYEID